VLTRGRRPAGGGAPRRRRRRPVGAARRPGVRRAVAQPVHGAGPDPLDGGPRAARRPAVPRGAARRRAPAVRGAAAPAVRGRRLRRLLRLRAPRLEPRAAVPPGLRAADAELEAPAGRLPRPGGHGRRVRHRRGAPVRAAQGARRAGTHVRAEHAARHRGGAGLRRRGGLAARRADRRGRVRRPRLRRGAGQRLVRPRPAGVGVRPARPAPGQELRHVDLAVGGAARGARGRAGAAARAGPRAPPLPARQRGLGARHRARRRVERGGGLPPAVPRDVLVARADARPHDGERGVGAHRRPVRLGHDLRAAAPPARRVHRAHLGRARTDHGQGRGAHVPAGRRRGVHLGHRTRRGRRPDRVRGGQGRDPRRGSLTPGPRRRYGRGVGTGKGAGEVEVLDVAGRQVRITSPGKVIFSARGETKLDLARYYLAVAGPLMAAMGGRPVLLQRFPKGATGPSFFQKRVAPTAADPWVTTTVVSTPNGTTSNALVAADLAHVLWAVNLGCLGFHVWPVTAADPAHADELRIDLDPSPGVTFAMIREAAAETKALLDELGVAGYPKTTGSRGIHVYVRLRPEWDGVAVRSAAVAVARELERRRPDLITASWWKE